MKQVLVIYLGMLIFNTIYAENSKYYQILAVNNSPTQEILAEHSERENPAQHVILSEHSERENPELIFLEAKKAAAKRQWDLFFALKSELLNYPLYPYLDYYYINLHFNTIDDKEIKNYIDTYPNTPMANNLRKKWLYEFASKNQWSNFLNIYKPDKSTSLDCLHRHALHNTGDNAKAFSGLENLWLTSKDYPDSCDSIFDKWLESNSNKDQLIMKRFELLLIDKKFDEAKKLIPLLSPQKKSNAQKIFQLINKPQLITQKSFLDKTPIADVISYGLWRLARINPQSAIKHWNNLRKKYTFTASQEQRIFQAIGLAMAVRKDTKSTKWFRKVLGADLAPVYKDWMIRSAIIYKDWQLVLDSVDALKEDERKSLRWQYWYGRALQQLGRTSEANKVLSEVSKERNYYGFLASYYLKKPITVKNSVLSVTSNEINTVKNMPGYQRAKLLYKLNLKHDARVELFTLMKHISEKEQYILSKLIAEWEWYPQALRLSQYPDHQDDITLRFPLPYRDQVDKNTIKFHIDPALVYAIMRQESYFMPFAKSSAGAVGLMQLMPATAKRTAKQFALTYNGSDDLVNSDNNIKLGTAHIKKLNQKFSTHPALVIAAYNAGKKAVKRWVPKKAIPTDVWIESVPYYETRGYLRSVIANYVVYQHRLGKTPSLDEIMSPITTQANG